jgi:hypothetical protein
MVPEKVGAAVCVALPGGSVSMDQCRPVIKFTSLPLLMAVTCEHSCGGPVSVRTGISVSTVIVQRPPSSVPPMFAQ